ncbi:tetratricopeptide repeat protein [Saccharicrinis sp. FJH54]|uniref:tetratricopeptide repeat-containing sensor histidine kinase n=1 Tax=Saccharicrinis sp. FJH54 TaxID=3344665 RepID=UPI0035D4F36A
MFFHTKQPLITVFLFCLVFLWPGKDGICADHPARTVSDTLRITALFKKGNQFIDGPSDSLVYYYSKALTLINRSLDDSVRMKKNLPDVYIRLRQFEFRAYIELGIEHFYQNSYDKALNNFFSALHVAQAIRDIDLLSECYSEIGIVYKNQGDFDKALSYYNSALEMAGQTADSSWIASCQINMANVYKGKGYFTIAQRYYFDALSTLERKRHDRRLAACYQNIGEIYQKQKDYNLALDYYRKSLDLGTSSKDRIRQIVINLNIGYVYTLKANYPEARNYLFKALNLYDETGYKHELDNCYLLLGDTYLYEQNLNEAKQYFTKALEIAERKDDRKSRVESERRLGELALLNGDSGVADRYFRRAYEQAKLLGSPELKIETAKALYGFLQKTGKYKEALVYVSEEMQLKDSLFSSEKYKAIKELEIQHNLEKKDQQLSLLTERTQVQELKLSRRNRMVIALVAVLVLMVIIGYLINVQNKLIDKHRAMELEQKLLRSQMNPHFIFNALIAIQSYIYKKEPVLAGDYLAKFADLIRLTLENSRNEFVPISREIKTMQTYIDLQSLRFEHMFKYMLRVDDALQTEGFSLPPMFAQPFIENAIEHGLRHRAEPGQLEVSYELYSENSIKIRINDNGIGREAAGKLKVKSEHTSLAMQITRDRLTVLNRKYRDKYMFNVVDVKADDGKTGGTALEIILPLKRK